MTAKKQKSNLDINVIASTNNMLASIREDAEIEDDNFINDDELINLILRYCYYLEQNKEPLIRAIKLYHDTKLMNEN